MLKTRELVPSTTEVPSATYVVQETIKEATQQATKRGDLVLTCRQGALVFTRQLWTSRDGTHRNLNPQHLLTPPDLVLSGFYVVPFQGRGFFLMRVTGPGRGAIGYRHSCEQRGKWKQTPERTDPFTVRAQ